MKNSTLLTFIILSAFFGSCENEFEPFEKTEKYVFSMNGYLDVHADTQWIRVMPIGETFLPQDSTINSNQVRLTREAPGESVVLNDSLFKFSGDTYVWNYWLPDSVIADEEYRITATDSVGKQSSVVVRTASELMVPEIEYDQDFEEISVSGVVRDSLILLETRYIVQAFVEVGCTPEREVSFSHLEAITEGSDGSFSFTSINREAIAEKLDVGPFSFQVNQRKLVLITAGEDWPDYMNFNDLEVDLPDVVSNVENGTGFVAGIARREISITDRQPPC
ncbi:MAG: hypothetical protein JJ953_00170 [Gracilimonas sp.]|uniref:hypothetical protein n=1 Tax=Gracilimonas TaxID=649462 RepID=UPI001B2992C8|nr:hypothetical protein [Gracilimonas sp.]MBO6584496.1 hypothetical protein [Gracilimonas sp.]MBO6616233.1 hypothetical protein [Gracilimonas sp.]